MRRKGEEEMRRRKGEETRGWRGIQEWRSGIK